MINDIINKYINNEKSGKTVNYSLEGITKLLEKLKNPHMNFKSVHIAGTNGKGSTAFMLAAILEKSGYKTGLYTSPHLVKINERIKINSADIQDALLFKYISEIDSIIFKDKSLLPTYFDILTAAAFKYFSDESVDIAIIETGLGGRLDSTNVIIPEISIITDISLDHVDILGNNITDITKEKCGIIKPDVPVITSNRDPEIISIIKETSCLNNSDLHSYDHDFSSQFVRRENAQFVFDYTSDDYKLPELRLSLFPFHQVRNAAVVINALLHLKSGGFPAVSSEVIYSVLEKIEVPGRFKVLNDLPLVIYDPAHNFDAIKNLISGLDTFYKDKKKIFIISMMRDKADNKTRALFADQDVYYFILDDERAYVPDNDMFKLITSEESIIVDTLQKLDNNYKMIIFTGTFRIYNHAVGIVEKYNKQIDMTFQDTI